jgi:REP-associated tyrosine transposase
MGSGLHICICCDKIQVMARSPRMEFPGAFYHIIVRGNQRQDIFVEDQDRVEYLRRLKHYKKERGFILYAFVLMTNHVHLLIETRNNPISKIMQLINLTYTQYFNKKYGKVGHLFQGRYKSFLCDRDEYLLSLVRYLHLNPVRAKLVKGPQEYRWSSHNSYLTEAKDLIDTDRVLKVFSERVSQARRKYREFIHEAIGEGRNEEFYRTIGQQVLGSDKFLEQIESKIGKVDRPLRKPSLRQILRAVKEETGTLEDDILSRRRSKEIMFARGVLVGVWREFGYRLVDLQPVLRRDLSVLSRMSKISDNREGRGAIERVHEMLNACMQA